MRISGDFESFRSSSLSYRRRTGVSMMDREDGDDLSNWGLLKDTCLIGEVLQRGMYYLEETGFKTVQKAVGGKVSGWERKKS